jgi:4a-hydroxytetrahydrobiopterin dehydratase
MNEPLTSGEIAAACHRLPGWTWQDDALVKTFAFGSFREAMGFMLRVSYEAEALNHHPDWGNVHHRVTVRLSTHDAGGRVTAKDVELAARMEAILPVG